jgi:hypothetical protein
MVSSSAFGDVNGRLVSLSSETELPAAFFGSTFLLALFNGWKTMTVSFTSFILIWAFFLDTFDWIRRKSNSSAHLFLNRFSQAVV